jgi:dihydrofolate reductase
MFKPSGADRQVVAEMFQRAGVMLTGRRTYDIANGWHGTHPVNGMPVVILTHERRSQSRRASPSWCSSLRVLRPRW